MDTPSNSRRLSELGPGERERVHVLASGHREGDAIPARWADDRGATVCDPQMQARTHKTAGARALSDAASANRHLMAETPVADVGIRVSPRTGHLLGTGELAAIEGDSGPALSRLMEGTP